MQRLSPCGVPEGHDSALLAPAMIGALLTNRHHRWGVCVCVFNCTHTPAMQYSNTRMSSRWQTVAVPTYQPAMELADHANTQRPPQTVLRCALLCGIRHMASCLAAQDEQLAAHNASGHTCKTRKCAHLKYTTTSQQAILLFNRPRSNASREHPARINSSHVHQTYGNTGARIGAACTPHAASQKQQRLKVGWCPGQPGQSIAQQSYNAVSQADTKEHLRS